MTEASPETLRRVDFGRLDAESDEKLLDYFIAVGTAQQAKEGKYLVVGRKGAGKTALFRHLTSQTDRTVVDLDLQDYVFAAHRGLVDGGVPQAFAFTESWRFAYIIAMFNQSYRSMPWLLRRKGRRILRKLGAGADGGAMQAILDWLSRVRHIEGPSIPGLVDLGALTLSDDQKRAFTRTTRQHIDELQSVVARTIRRRPITVLVDRLDDAWDGSDESLRLIGGAARAARQLANTLKQSGAAPVVVFLRSDLWERVDFNDKNKFIQDTVTLDWSEDDLRRVLEERVSKTAGVPAEEGWSSVFEDDRLRQGTSPLKYILKRTMGRPRDMIAYAIFAREVALTHDHSRITRPDIYEAESKYSRHMLDELRDELGAHVQSMDAVVATLRGVRRRKFDADVWEQSATRNGMSREEADRVLARLFEASAIGVLRDNNNVEFRYSDRLLEIDATGRLSIHQALVKELGVTDN